MSDQAEPKRPARRGEAAWQAALDAVAERNAAARKAGKAKREAYERQRAEARHASEQRERARLVAKHN
jgi:hypothetical protein